MPAASNRFAISHASSLVVPSGSPHSLLLSRTPITKSLPHSSRTRLMMLVPKRVRLSMFWQPNSSVRLFWRFERKALPSA